MTGRQTADWGCTRNNLRYTKGRPNGKPIQAGSRIKMISLFGLLYLSEDDSSLINGTAKNFQDRISIYVNCAINLSNSLREKGIVFTLLTNRKQTVEQFAPSERMALRVEEIPFHAEVPTRIRFYSAHFKVDVYRYLSSLSDEYVGLCDLDMICINDLPNSFINNMKQGIPMCYDISDQVIPAYGHDVIIRDLESIHGLESEGRWFGGEFISGTPGFFLMLIRDIDSIYGNYLSNIEHLHHVGDEMFTSAALEIIRKRGTYVADAGTLGIVGRFWNARTLHPQKPFKYFTQCFLLHLPADKRFLADLKWKKETTHSFNRFYSKYRKYSSGRYKRLIKRVARMVIPKSRSH